MLYPLELLAFFVLLALTPPTNLFSLFMNCMLVAETAVFLKLQLIRSIPLILGA